MPKKTGVLLTNTGTPDAPTPSAVRRYLREFLSDKHVIQIPRIVWLPILYGLILTMRPYKSAKLYQKIWTEHGSPMRVIMQTLRDKLCKKLSAPVEIGMNYGNPSIQDGLERLRKNNVEKIMILPLYPQYSNTTTASSFDRVDAIIKKWPTRPEILLIHDYANHPDYIHALALSILSTWEKRGTSAHLIISFHGIPQRFIANGDPYQSQCELTATLLAKELKLSKDKWTLCYQSQFGYDKWLQPSTFNLLVDLPKQGIKHIDIICPGFAVDCLETLEEIAIRGKEIFLQAGGQSFQYIPALNDSDQQVEILTNITRARPDIWT